MKVNSLFILSTALLFAGCVNEIVSNEQNGQEPQVNLVPVTFQAGSEEDSDADTKVTLGGVDNKSVLWTKDDQIKVFDKISNNLSAFTVSSGAGTTLAAISGSVSEGATGNFYAMYPYQADATFTSGETKLGNDTVIDGYITLEVPAEQKAVAGSLDPAAFIGVGQCKEGTTRFNFKNATAFVKFQLSPADIENLETVSFSGNSLGSVAGKIKIGFTESGSVAQTYVSGAGAQYITLSKPEGGWESGVDYYFAIRPLKFADGFTITARYTDNSCRHLTTTKGITNSNGEAQTVSRNCTMNLGSLPKMKAGLPNDLYIAYLHGQDINIAGTKVNKTTHPDANYISAESEDKTIKAGVNFVAPDANALFSTAALPMPLYVAGNSEGTRSPIKTDGQIKLASATDTQNTFAMENVDLTAENITTNYLIANWYDFAIEKISIANCGITLPDNKSLIYVNKDRPVNAFSMTDSDVKVSQTDASKNINMIQTTETYTMTEVNFTNNVFWSPADVKGFNLLLNRKVTAANLIVSHNTLVNLYPAASYAFCQV
ncbi:MAG: fimbrillin family protein, partial [Bacteroidales bacterium]|nr:fimbrillin family protein [Bacteroidales bacterium]